MDAYYKIPERLQCNLQQIMVADDKDQTEEMNDFHQKKKDNLNSNFEVTGRGWK